jgi:hypothetical protein
MTGYFLVFLQENNLRKALIPFLGVSALQIIFLFFYKKIICEKHLLSPLSGLVGQSQQAGCMTIRLLVI